MDSYFMEVDISKVKCNINLWDIYLELEKKVREWDQWGKARKSRGIKSTAQSYTWHFDFL